MVDRSPYLSFLTVSDVSVKYISVKNKITKIWRSLALQNLFRLEITIHTHDITTNKGVINIISSES